MNQSKTDKKQVLKKYGVFAIMGVIFCLSMWFIFKPSEAGKENEQVGLNADIPDPQSTGMVDNKIMAYEQDMMREKKEERMRSLQDYSFTLGEDGSKNENAELLPLHAEEDNSVAVSASGAPGGYSARKSNSSRTYGYSSSSSAAYSDMNRTLGSFYEKKEDPEKEAMKKELEELKNSIKTVDEVKKPSYEEQVAMMEKSYELAAKYMGGSQQQETPEVQNGKIRVAPVRQLRQHIVSSLSQPMTNQEFVEQLSKIRNTGFNTVNEDVTAHDRNTISAIIHDNQTVTGGQMVRLRLTEPMVVDKRVVPVNTILTGTAHISGERVNISITSIEHDGTILPVELTAYDMDGQQGIYVPSSMEINAAKEIAGNMGGSLGSSINISQQSAGDQLLGDLGRSVIQGTSQYVAAKAREVKVTLKAGHRIMLLISEQP